MAASLSMRSVCSFVGRVNFPNRTSYLFHTCARPAAPYQYPTALRNTRGSLCTKHAFKTSDYPAVSVHACQRTFFTKRTSSSLKEDSKPTSTDNQQAAQDPQVPEEEDDVIIPKTDEKGQPLSNWKRMKIMMKAYGYVIIPVHWVIAPVWFGAFYYTIKL